MRWLLRGVATLVAVALVLLLIGLTRPQSHTAKTRAHYAASPGVLWATLADVERWPEWNPEVISVERTGDRDGRATLNVVGSWGAAPTELAVFDPPNRLRTEMHAGDFSGAWTYELEPVVQGGTLLTVTEEGRVESPLFRAMMLFHDSYATMMEFHRALGARLGEAIVAEKVPPAQVERPSP